MSYSAAPEYRGASFHNVIAAIVCGLWVALGASAPLSAAPVTQFQNWSGDAPPAFALTDTAGVERKLDSARGPVVLVHFFATWCEPCRDELPALNRLAARGKGTVTVLAISVAEVDLRVRKFLETMPLDFPVLLDRDRAIAKSWNVSTLPSTVVLDANLRPRLVVESDFAWDSIDPASFAAAIAAHARSPSSLTSSTDLSAIKLRPDGG